jgi:hypothetical protein
MPTVSAFVNPSDAPYSQVGPNDPSGNQFSTSPAIPLGFFGAVPVAQPGGANQAAWTRGTPAGVVTTYSTSQSPSAVAANTSAEAALTVQTGTGAVMLAAAGDVVYFNRAASQAGLGNGNARVSAGNTVSVTFTNWTSGSITPTASEVYKIVTIRGLPAISPVLTPAAVAAGATVEQQFAVTGLPVGALVNVSKPTQQAGLDIVGMRVVSANVLGITFVNVTAAPITPTAAETYTVNVLFGLDATSNTINYGFNVGTVGAIGPGVVVSGGSSTLTGVLATDSVTGIYDPTAQAAATNAAYPVKGVPTANTLTLYFAGIGTGATPTASEVYTIQTNRLAPVAPLLNYSQTLTPTSVAANTTAEQTFTVTGLVAGTPVWVNKPSWSSGIGIAGVRVSAANTLAITFTNSTTAAITPPSETYLIGNFQVPAPGAGNSVYQVVSQVINYLGNLTLAMRSALASMGLIAGA